MNPGHSNVKPVRITQISDSMTEIHRPTVPPGTRNGRLTSGNFLRSVMQAGRLKR